MKSLLAKLGIALGIAFSAQTLAAEWIEVYSDDKISVEIDQSSIRSKGNNVVELWERWTNLTPPETGWSRSVSRTLNECDALRTKILSSVYYYESQAPEVNNSASEFAFIVPDSVGEAVFNAICDLGSHDSSHSSGATSVQKRTVQNSVRHENPSGVIRCKTPGVAAKCGKYEECRDDESKLNDYALQQQIFGLVEAHPSKIYSCDSRITETLWEQNCLATNDEPCYIHLDGEITGKTAHVLSRVIREFVVPAKRGNVDLFLNSNGGDIDAAMEIGGVLREFQASVAVPIKSTCASACVLVFAGASRRSSAGPVIIHRPFRAEAVELGAEEAQRQYFLRNLRIRNYLVRMNVSPTLLEAMIAVPPEKSRTLTREEIDGFGMLSMDPVYQEELDAKNAKDLGITMVAWLDRKRQVDECLKGLRNSEPMPTGGFEGCVKIYGFKEKK